MNDNSKVLVSLLAGMAAGIVVGILFAPEKGAGTRHKLNESLKNLGDEIKNRIFNEIDHLVNKGDHIKDLVVKEVENLSNNKKEKLLSQAQQAVEKSNRI